MKGEITIKSLRVIILTIISLLFVCSTAYASTDYTVQSGDTLYSISRSYHTEVASLLDANPSVTDEGHIVPGQKVTIPNAKEESFRVTAYTAGYESTGKHPGDKGYGVTASGKTVKEKQTIACPPSMPFGTEIYIPAMMETYTCEDRGSAITEGKLDIYTNNLNEALQFGVQHLDVQILN
ncbi:LysM peptidoglycan-binding domain-containing protein [Virgibacillus halophilus]|uniref:LysM peptidoglycan-binding domain-containing protein n=1 Tax=Tigheibacillus halophilus TaxID=361280 RepID=A0ABU5C5C8_9BACI|nr:LysM peptidoglycan-binding domain-containing protein [Virgibacillus halophilus]